MEATWKPNSDISYAGSCGKALSIWWVRFRGRELHWCQIWGEFLLSSPGLHVIMNEGEDAVRCLGNPSRPSAYHQIATANFSIRACQCACVCSHEPTAIITARRTDWREAKSDQAEMNLSWHTLFIFLRGFTNVPAWLKPPFDKAIWRALQWISAGNDTMQMHHLCQRRNLLDLSYSFLKWCRVEFG